MRQTTIFVFLVSSLLTCGAAASSPPATGEETLPQGASQDWLSQVQKSIADREYQLTWQDRTVLSNLDSAWHAPNRAQGFRAYFTSEGVRVVPRTGESPSWEWGLSLIGLGRQGSVRPVETARLVPTGNRVEYDREGLLEWYVNSPKGLKQGFILASPPEGAALATGASGISSRIHLDMKLAGTLTPTISTDGQSIEFATARGVNVVRYAELQVTDAAGRELPAWMEGFADGGVRGVRLVFEDDDALYPVTVDPLATGASWTAEGNQIDASFSCSVGTAGDVNGDGYADIIVGAKDYDNGLSDEGQAFVFHGSASGSSAVEDWTAESDQAGASFGIAVGTAGDVNGDGYADVIVGASAYDNDQTDEGRAYVYHGSATGLSGAADWTAESDQAGASFGITVATTADVNGDGYADVIVGADHYDNGQTDEGRAFVYHGSATGLSATADWAAESDQADAYFGSSVGTAGDVDGDGYADVIVGADHYDNGETDEGRAFVYYGSATGLGAIEDWSTEGGQVGTHFGSSVGTAGDVNGDGYADVIVGAYGYDALAANIGRASVYHGSPSGLSASADWADTGLSAFAYFGYSVGTAGDVNGDGYADVIIGAHGTRNGHVGEGRAYVYQGSAAGLRSEEDWTAESGQENAWLGFSVGTAGDVDGDGYADVIVGAVAYDNGQDNEGRAYVYHGAAAGLSAVDGWQEHSGMRGAMYGHSAGTAGDVNGDGYADIIVGAYKYDNGLEAEGRAYLYLGSAIGLSTVESWAVTGKQRHGWFGFSVATAGDVNGDGYADVIVGAHAWDAVDYNEGRVFVYHGSATGLQADADWWAEGGSESDHFGFSVGTAGDVNGDGYSDVVIGATRESNGQNWEGRAYLYRGSAGGLGSVPSWAVESDVEGATLGFSVGTAGDVNGDGHSDVVVGARSHENDEGHEGKAYVYHGSADGLSPLAAWTAEGDTQYASFGGSVGTAGDVNGDGYADVIVGAYRDSNGHSLEGIAYVYHGSAAGLSATADWTAEGNQSEAQFGGSVGTAGDVNGDGYADVIVGAQYYDNPTFDEGRAYVYHGSASGLSAVADWTAGSDSVYAEFGAAVGTAGDVNGDGFAEVIVGARKQPGDVGSEGGAYVYYGNDTPGLSLRPQQRRADDSAAIGPLGMSDSLDSFRLAILGRTPFGRGKVKLEWEVKPLGVPFDDSGGIVSDTWVDSGTAGAELNELVSGLTVGERYHWRVRLHYHPSTTPLQQTSRWLTVPRNGWQETDLRTRQMTIGDRVWEDSDGNGIQDAEESNMAGLSVTLHLSSGTQIDSTQTDPFGRYSFRGLSLGAAYYVRFIPPAGYIMTLRDQGGDDLSDSDADPTTGATPLFNLLDANDSIRWDAGMYPECVVPDEPVYIDTAGKTDDGNSYPILSFQDFNDPSQVTGYNVYRSSDAGLPPGNWPLIATDAVDMDGSAPGIQWIDTSGDASPTGVWYYDIAAYNQRCPAEGPH